MGSPENSYRRLPATTGLASIPHSILTKPHSVGMMITHGETESQPGTSPARGHPASAPGFPAQRQHPSPDARLMLGSIFCLPPGSPLRPGAMGVEAARQFTCFSEGGGGGLPYTSHGARGFFLKCLPGETRIYACHQEGEASVFPRTPHTPGQKSSERKRVP